MLGCTVIDFPFDISIGIDIWHWNWYLTLTLVLILLWYCHWIWYWHSLKRSTAHIQKQTLFSQCFCNVLTADVFLHRRTIFHCDICVAILAGNADRWSKLIIIFNIKLLTKWDWDFARHWLMYWQYTYLSWQPCQ